QHLNEARPVHADCLTVVRCVFHGDELSRFVDRAARSDAVVVIEGQTVKTLCQDEDFRYAVAAGSWSGHIVTARARVCIGRRDAVEVPRKDQWSAGIRYGRTRSF